MTSSSNMSIRSAVRISSKSVVMVADHSMATAIYQKYYHHNSGPFSNIAYKLCIPLNGITMRLNVIRSIGNVHYRDYVNTIHISAAFLFNLTNKLFDITKIESR